MSANSTAARVYDFISGWRATHAYPPSVREIAEGVGLHSTSSVSYYLSELRRRGVLTYEDGHARTARIVRPLPMEGVR